jgi:ribosomal protein L25 (general stress protein Ctc)
VSDLLTFSPVYLRGEVGQLEGKRKLRRLRSNGRIILICVLKK